MERRRFIVSGLSLCSSLFLSACVPKVNLSEYSQSELDSKEAKHELPSYVVNKKKPRVAVLPFGVSDENLKKCGVGKVAQEAFINVLAKAGTVDVVERGQIEAVMNEAKFSVGIGGDVDLSKLSKLGSVDYVLVGSVSGSVSARFIEGGYVEDKKTGKPTYIPPACKEVGAVNINSRVLKFPSGSVITSNTLDGEKTFARNVRNPNECKVQDPCGLLNKATAAASEEALKSLKSAFPLYGYVYKTMTHKDKKGRIAFITLGTSDGVKAGDKVAIVEFVQEKDSVKNTLTYRETVVAKCTVAETDLAPDKSICIVESERAEAVLPRHAAKTIVEKSIWDRLKEANKVRRELESR